MYQKGLQNESSAVSFHKFEYKRGMGAFKPHFETIPEDYYPLSNWEVFKYSVYVLFLIGAGCGLMIGIIFWGTGPRGTAEFIMIWVIIFLVTFAVVIVLLYFAGMERITLQKKMIEEAQRKQEQMAKKKVDNEQRRENLFEKSAF